MEVELPKIYSVYEVCAKFLPQAVGTIKNRARIQADGSYLARLGGGQSLRLVSMARCGDLWGFPDLPDLRERALRLPQQTKMAARCAGRGPAQLCFFDGEGAR
jgi:hypothetical protein